MHPTSKNSPLSSLFVNDFTFLCLLGCYPEEQTQKQEVSVSLKMEFSEIPQACMTDNLEDTLCYENICNEIKAVGDKKLYKTVEHLSFEIFLTLKKIIPNEYRWSIKLRKVNPPIEGLKNGVIFELEHRP
jgi:dihydroneopterin aldolase